MSSTRCDDDETTQATAHRTHRDRDVSVRGRLDAVGRIVDAGVERHVDDQPHETGWFWAVDLAEHVAVARPAPRDAGGTAGSALTPQPAVFPLGRPQPLSPATYTENPARNRWRRKVHNSAHGDYSGATSTHVMSMNRD